MLNDTIEKNIGVTMLQICRSFIHLSGLLMWPKQCIQGVHMMSRLQWFILIVVQLYWILDDVTLTVVYLDSCTVVLDTCCYHVILL